MKVRKTISNIVTAVMLVLALAAFGFAQNGNGSQQDNSSGNAIDNHSSDSGRGNDGVNNGNSHDPSQGGGNGQNPLTINNSATSTSTANANASSSSQSASTSSANATGGNANAQGGQATSVATGGQGGSAYSGGNVQKTTFVSPRNAPSGYAPTAFPTAPCRVAYSGAGSWLSGSAALGFSRDDEQCEFRALASAMAAIGNRQAAAHILCQTKVAKKLKLSEADCQAEEVSEPQALQPTSAPAITVNVPAPQIIREEVFPEQRFVPEPTPTPTLQSKPTPKPKKVKKAPTNCPTK